MVEFPTFPDINPIEKQLSLVKRVLYDNGKQFAIKDDFESNKTVASNINIERV